MAYATPAECKLFTALAKVQAKSDAELTALISRSERLINTYTRNDFNAFPAIIVLLDGTGSRRLPLEKRIEALSAVTFLTPNGADELLTAQELAEIEAFEWHLAAHLTFPAGIKNIKLLGDFGYTAVPQEVKDAICLLVETIVLRDKDAAHKGGTLKKEKIGDYSYELSDAAQGNTGSLSSSVIPAEARLLLRSFRRVIMPRVAKRRDETGRFNGRTHFFGGE